MKECKKYRQLFSGALYNELSEAQRKAWQVHLKDCRACAVEYEHMLSVLETMDQRQRPRLSETYWDIYWYRLEEKLAQENIPAVKAKSPFTFRLRYALYPVSAVVFILLGIFIGKYLYPPARTGDAKDNQALVRVYPALARHFDNLRPLLLGYANYTYRERTLSAVETVQVDKEILQKLILENYLLKRAVAKTGDVSQKELLDELELILLEISSMNGQELQTIMSIQDILKDKQILFKMRIFNNSNKRRTLIRI